MRNAVMRLEAMPAAVVGNVRKLEHALLQLPQAEIKTEHSFHAGVYARTVLISAGVVLTGALIKIPTMLIFNGDAVVVTPTGTERWVGYRVVLAPAERKMAFYAKHATNLTMLFATTAQTVDEAEQEFTDEYEALLSRKEF